MPNGVGAVADLWTLGGGTIDLGSSKVTLSALSLYSTGATSYDIIATAGGSLVLQGSGGLPANVVVVGGKQMIAAPVTLSTPADVAIDNSTDSLAISGAISGSGALNLSGNGTLVLSGSDSYSGGTVVQSGTLVFDSSDSIRDGSRLTVGANASVIFGSAASGEAASLAAAVPVPEPGTLMLLAAVALMSQSKRLFTAGSNPAIRIPSDGQKRGLATPRRLCGL